MVVVLVALCVPVCQGCHGLAAVGLQRFEAAFVALGAQRVRAAPGRKLTGF